MEYDRAKKKDWHNVTSFAELAEAMHKKALELYRTSAYAKEYGPPRLELVKE